MDNKIKLIPGDYVLLNKHLQDKPDIMLVIGEERTGERDSILVGIKCLFFDKLGIPHEYVFNTKDLDLFGNVE